MATFTCSGCKATATLSDNDLRKIAPPCPVCGSKLVPALPAGTRACPKCGGPSTIGKDGFDGSGHAIKGAAAGGLPVVALGILALKAGKMMGLYGRTWWCTKCGHGFTP